MNDSKIHLRGSVPSWSSLVNKLEEKIKRFDDSSPVNAIRSRVSSSCLHHATKSKGRVLRLSVPTGGGKTLSSLRFALNHANLNEMDRIIYIVPYTSIIEQNAKEARTILEDEHSKGRVVLECHSYLADETQDEVTKLISDNWNAPIVFTTMVQFLESIYSHKISRTRRMHTLANSILIFDEIQCIPKNCIFMFNEFINFITTVGNSTVVLCTATQPLLDKLPPGKDNIDRSLEIIEENNIIQYESSLFSELKRVQINDKRKRGGWDYEEICEFVYQLNTANVLIIVNTKSSAASLYKKMNTYENVDCYYLSTNLCPEHRSDTFSNIHSRLSSPNSNANKLVCVSTQLIEAGVDIDFECVIRFISGLDSIAQSAGRCNRNGKMHVGHVYIINPKKENLVNLDDIKEGIVITKRLLDEYDMDPSRFDNNLLGPKAIERYFSMLYHKYANYNDRYFEYDVSMIDSTLFELLSRNEKNTRSYLKRGTAEGFNHVLVQSFKLAAENFHAIESSTEGVIVPYKQGEDIIDQLMHERDPLRISVLLKEAQRYSINIYPHQFEQLWGSCIHEVQQGLNIYYISKEYYCDEVGLCDGEQSTLIF
jgi:CRISPR-associated endonuclease/helicase Cas3